MRKHIYPLLFGIALLFTFCPSAQASHAAGAELTYTWKSDSTYIITYHFYRDCSGIPAPDSVSVCYENNCDGYQNNIYLRKTTLLDGGRPNGSDVLIACPSFPTVCHSGTLPGYQEWWYSTTVTLPSRCRYWRFSHTESARNYAIKNITPDNLEVETFLDNFNAQGNSSPYFTIKPVPYVCNNIPFVYSNGAIDPNGDSLSFEFITPETAGSDCDAPNNETYLSGYDLYKNPLACDSTFSFDTLTGQMSFTPSLTGEYALTVRTSEYRNISGTWTKIGSVMRDIQVVVIAGSSHTPTISIIDSTIFGLTKSGEQYYACATVPFGFSFDARSVDTDAVLVVTDNAATLGDSVTYSHTFSDSVRGHLTWTTHANDTGLKTILITVKDSACTSISHIPVSNTYVVPVYVSPVTKIYSDTAGGRDTAAICPNDSLKLTAIGGGNFVWDVLPGGASASSLSCTTCKTTFVRPGVTTSYVVHATTGTRCNSRDTITINVRTALIPSVTLTASPDSFISSTTTTTFTATAVNGGTKPVFRWYQDGILVTGDSANTYIVHGGITDKDSITVRLHSNAVCAIPDTASAHIKLKPSRLIVADIAGSNNNIRLYPNPNEGDFTLTAYIGNAGSEASIEIIDMAGRIVYKETAATGNGRISKHIALKNNMAAGRYILFIRDGNTAQSISFTLQK